MKNRVLKKNKNGWYFMYKNKKYYVKGEINNIKIITPYLTKNFDLIFKKINYDKLKDNININFEVVKSY